MIAKARRVKRRNSHLRQPKSWLQHQRRAFRHEPHPASDIIEALEKSERWHPKTVKTLLNRLVKKGALGFAREGRAYLYRLLVAESACTTAVSEAFLARVW